MSYPYFTVLIWKDPTKRVKSKHKKNHRHLNFLPEKKREKNIKRTVLSERVLGIKRKLECYLSLFLCSWYIDLPITLSLIPSNTRARLPIILYDLA